jgi:hypothetical protein
MHKIITSKETSQTAAVSRFKQNKWGYKGKIVPVLN